MKRFIVYRQLDQMDCGPACLKMVFKYYGKTIDLKRIKRVTQLKTTGASLLALSEAASAFGVNTISAKFTYEQLISDAELPCILHWDQYHFVVLTPSSNRKKLVVADPSRGLITYTKEEFLKSWISSNDGGEAKGIALVLSPTSVFHSVSEDEDSKVMSWGLLKNYLLNYRKQIAQLVLGLVAGSALQLIFPYLTQAIVDTGIRTKNLSFIQLILIAQFALFFSQTLVEFVRSQILLFLSTHISLRILSDFWIKLLRLPLHFFESKQTGDILQRISDHRRIETFITGNALQTVFSVFNLLVFSIVLYSYDVLILTVFLIGSALYLLWIRLFLRYRGELDHKRFALGASESSATMQLIQGIQEIKLNNAENLKRWEWESIQSSLFRLNLKSLTLAQYQQGGAFFINQAKNILVIYLTARFVIAGDLTLGAMLAIQYIIAQLNNPVEQLVSFTQQAQYARLSLERLNEIHQLDDEEPLLNSFTHEVALPATITLKHLTFAYPGAGNSMVLTDLNVSFEGGKVTAIVGTSGSGKTTLLKLLQKFYDGYEGEIEIDKHNLKSVSPSYWRSISGSVMQDGFLFSDTIAKNIAVSDEHADQGKLDHACAVANIKKFIDSLPLGYETKIGAEGNGISTGQKQRLLIARAVYKNPFFLLFDEATNALDANNETAIMENLGSFFEGRTVIIVAHRLSTVKNADKIIVLENGKMIEEGNHASLIHAKGKYYELVKNQLELDH